MKRVAILLLAFVLAVGILAGCGSNTNETESTTQPTTEVAFNGSGTAAAPYQIATADDLWKMAELVNTEEETYRDAHYILIADIDLGGKAWTPIGDGYLDSFKSFPGTFDGDGHTISGLNITTNSEDKTRFFGLFGQVEGTVKDLTIASSTIDCSGKDSATTGAIVGCVYYDGTIENCHVAADVTVTGTAHTGGLVGQMYGVMANCTNAAVVTATSDVAITGGLAGTVVGNQETNGIITGCTNTGAVTSPDQAGGVAGSLLKGSVADSANKGTVSGTNTAGGIVGTINAAETDGSVDEYAVSGCDNSGTVTANEDAGGVIARVIITTGNVSVENCSNSAAVLGGNMGGILGAAQTSTASASLTVSGCTNSGALENAEADGTTEAGGIAASVTCKAGGTIVLSENKNTGAIDAGTGRAGGILGTYFSAMSDEGTAVTLDIADCANAAAISGGPMGIGGIVGEVSAASYPAVSLTVSGCSNSGDLYGNTANVRIGGIVGVIEPHYCTAAFTACANSGNISCEGVTITEGEAWFDFSAAMGGILGYAGVNGVSLTPEDDCGLGSTTVLTFDGCQNSGTMTPANEKVEYYTGDICGLSVVGTEIR